MMMLLLGVAVGVVLTVAVSLAYCAYIMRLVEGADDDADEGMEALAPLSPFERRRW